MHARVCTLALFYVHVAAVVGISISRSLLSLFSLISKLLDCVVRCSVSFKACDIWGNFLRPQILRCATEERMQKFRGFGKS